jgi:hypothetical protein
VIEDDLLQENLPSYKEYAARVDLSGECGDAGRNLLRRTSSELAHAGHLRRCSENGPLSGGQADPRSEATPLPQLTQSGCGAEAQQFAVAGAHPSRGSDAYTHHVDLTLFGRQEAIYCSFWGARSSGADAIR